MKDIIMNRYFIREVVIPHYLSVLRPLFNQLTVACGSVKTTSDFYNYIYGFDLNVPSVKTKDLWRKISLINAGNPWHPTMPNDHQRRQYYPLPKTFYAIDGLSLNVVRINKCKDFEELYDYVDSIFKQGGRSYAYLSIYDTAYRIGFNLTPQILPEKYVYLNAGAYKGADNLYGKSWILKNDDKRFVNRNHTKYSTRVKTTKFKQKFGNLDSVGIESLLCIIFS